MHTLKFSRILLIAGLALTPMRAAWAGEGELLSGEASDSVAATVSSGGLVLLGPFSSIDARCRKTSDAQAWIVERPRYGRASAVKQRGEIAYGPEHHFAYCNDRPVVGTMIRYQSARGFAGDDTFVFVLRFRDGEVRAKRVNVHVE